MSNVFTCPFCKKPLVEFIPNSVYACNEHKMFVDLHARRAYFTERSPRYLRESFEFLKEFELADPSFVLSPEPLWSGGFMLDVCEFVNCRGTQMSVKNTTANHVNAKSISNKHLIAGERLLADNILDLFYSALDNKAKYCPFVRTKVPEPGRLLWLKVLFASVNADKDYVDTKSFTLAKAYFSTSLESTIDVMLHTFGYGLGKSLTDEEALYSIIFMQPQINIAWGVGKEGMCKSILQYIAACVKDMNLIQSVSQINYVRPKVFLNTDFFDQLESLYLTTMPSTAVNQGPSKLSGKAHFDIMNHVFSSDVLSGYNPETFTNNDLLVLMNTYYLLQSLWEKYAKDNKRFDLVKKMDVYRSITNTDDYSGPDDTDAFLLAFWQAMEKYIATEINYEET